ncbi:MAG: HAD family hydrolase [Desulfobacteraceae bacterium]|nr:HAD family hydrolase [Desulfobacteraceae bacterium]
MTNYQAVLFDLDGTLLDTLSDIAGAVNRALGKNGFPGHSIDVCRSFVGDGARTLITRALPEDAATDETIDRCLADFRQDYALNWHLATRPYPQIPELLDQLSGRGVRFSVLSNKPHEFTVKCVEKFLSAWPFEVVFGQREHVPLKPDPSSALEIAHLMDVPPAALLFVGDSPVDMKTAVNAGMDAVGAGWGFTGTKALAARHSGAIVKSPLEILEWI